MPCTETRQRVAVIVPQRRSWVWHQRIISALQQSYEVDVYVSARAPNYPLSLRLWIRLETQLIGELDLVKIWTISTKSWSHFGNATYPLILNLSEAPINDADTLILEPRFEGSTDSLRLFAALLSRTNPYLSFHLAGQQEPIVASYLAIQDRTVLIRGLRSSFARLVALAERAARHLTQGSRAAILPEPADTAPALSLARMSSFVVRFILHKLLGRLVRRFRLQEHWSIALLWGDQLKIPRGVPLQEFVILPDDRRRFYADPFLFANEGQKWLFVEEFDYQIGKGIISCTQLTIGEKTPSPTPVLVRPYHLSYPFVFQHGDAIYMIPETGSNRTVELYRARSFPFDWTLCHILMDNVELYDATLLRHQDRWWIFGAVAHDGGSSQDELGVFYSDRLEGPWRPHRLNPVKSDCRSARPAGHIITSGDRLLRPAQDCEKRYGSAIVWFEIEELTPDRFRESEVIRWPGNTGPNADGLHTFNCDGELGVIDTRRPIWKWPLQR